MLKRCSGKDSVKRLLSRNKHVYYVQPFTCMKSGRNIRVWATSMIKMEVKVPHFNEAVPLFLFSWSNFLHTFFFSRTSEAATCRTWALWHSQTRRSTVALATRVVLHATITACNKCESNIRKQVVMWTPRHSYPSAACERLPSVLARTLRPHATAWEVRQTGEKLSTAIVLIHLCKFCLAFLLFLLL